MLQRCFLAAPAPYRQSQRHTDCTGGNRHPDTAIAHQQPTAYENSHKHHHGCQEGLAWRKAAQSKTYQQHRQTRSEEHTSELQSLMRISNAVFCLKKKNKETTT